MSYYRKLESKIRDLSQSDFIRNALLLLGGALVAQIISMSAGPFITRLFTPQNLGVLALYSAIINIISGESSLCYERAIVLPKTNEEAINVYLLSLYIHLGISFGLLFILPFFKGTIEGLLNIDIHFIWFWLIPLGVLLAGIGKNLKFWRIRNKHFKSITTAQIFQASTTAVFKVVFGFVVGALAGGLIAGFILGTTVFVFFVYSRPSALRIKEYKSHISRAKIIELARRYKKFPLFASWNSLLSQLSEHIIIFMFSYFFDVTIVGFYSLCNRFLGRPVSMVAQSVQSAYFQKAAENLTKGVDLKKNLQRITAGLFLTGFFPILILIIWGETIFTFVFGQDWATAGQYVQIMAPWYLSTYLMSPANVIFEVCQKQNIRLGFNILLMTSRFAALLVGYNTSRDPQFTILLFVIVSSFIQFCIIVAAFIIARKEQSVG